MNEDLMSTQTGGEGQTIQAMPDTNPTPADFSANINPQQVQNPPVKVPTVEQTAGAPQVQIPNQEAQSATALIQPTNENVPQMPTEQTEETKVDVPEGYTDEWYNEITNPPVTQQETTTVTEEETKQPVETINGVKPFTIKQEEVVTPQVVAPVEKQVQQKPVETINGVKPFTVKPEVSPEEQKVQKEYKKAGINVKPVKTVSKKEDGLYTYNGTNYQLDNGQWKIWNKQNKQYTLLDPRTDVKGRSSALNKLAKPIEIPQENVQKVFGNLGGEIPESMQTNALGINMGILTKSNVGNASQKYNQDGTLNFYYDPNVASASQGAQNILQYKPQEKKKISAPKMITGANDFNLVKKYEEAGIVPSVKEIQTAYKENTLSQANNFAQKNIDKSVGNSLTENQKQELKKQQQVVQSILAKGDNLSSEDVNTLNQKLAKIDGFVNDAGKFNSKVNEAVRQGSSLDKLMYETKKQNIDDIGNSLVNKDYLQQVKDEFQSSSAIADYILAQVDAGKMRWDRTQNKYVLSNNLAPQEIQHIQNKIASLNSEYNKSKQERFNAVNEKTDELVSQKSRYESEIRAAQNQLDKLEKGSDEYNSRLNFINERKKHLSFIDSKIKSNEDYKLNVFQTNPKQTVKNMLGTTSETAKEIASAIPSNISAKTKFDLYYTNLAESNKKLAEKYSINTGYLDRVGESFRDLLDWGGYMSLSKEEKEYLKNRALLNQIAPLYYNNTTGLTKNSSGFFESVWNGFTGTLFPNVSGAAGIESQTKGARGQAQIMKELGFKQEDLVDKDVVKKLEERAASKMLSAEGMGESVGSSMAMVAAYIASDIVPVALLKAGSVATKLSGAYNTANKSKNVLSVASKVYNNTLKNGKYGKFFTEVAEEGLKAEMAGRFIGSTKDELNFALGAAGGVASELLGGIISKLPKDKTLGYLTSIFGDSTPQAVKALGKIGQASTTSVTETGEEVLQELTTIYTDENRKKGFFQAVKERFPDLNSVQEFIISSAIMGGAFGLAQSNKASQLYNDLPQDKKEEVNSILSDVNNDFEQANGAVEDLADEVTDVEEKKKAVDKTEPKKEEKKETKVEPEGEDEIIFDVGDLSTIEPETEITEELPVESTFTQPIDLTNDKENEQGVSGKVGEGEKPVETEPVAEPSKEEVSPSGVVQEEQEVKLNENLPKVEIEAEVVEEKPTETKSEKTKAEPKQKRNVKKVSVTLDEGQVNLIKRTPVFSTFFYKEQLDSLKPGENILFMNHSAFGKFQRMGYGEVKDITDVTSTPAETKSEEGLTPEETEGRDEIVKSKGTITTTKPARIFKGLFGKKNPDGTVRTAHPDVKGTWGALDKKLAEKYRENEDEVLKEFEIPAGTTVETIEIPMKGLTLGQYRKLETDAINNSSAQVVKLITKDATARMQTQMVIKDAAISGYKAKETIKKAEVIAKKMVDGKEALNAAEQSYLMDNQDEVQSAIDKIESTQKAETTQTTSNPFADLKAVNKHGIRSAKRREAIADFDAKHGEGAYNRVSKIDANFDSIINKLEKNNLIEKEC